MNQAGQAITKTLADQVKLDETDDRAEGEASERGALARAAQQAGFEKIRIVNEPTAAALSIGVDGRFLIIDRDTCHEGIEDLSSDIDRRTTDGRFICRSRYLYVFFTRTQERPGGTSERRTS